MARSVTFLFLLLAIADGNGLNVMARQVDEEGNGGDNRLLEAINNRGERRLGKKKVYGMMGKRADRCAGKGLPMGVKTCSPISDVSSRSLSHANKPPVASQRMAGRKRAVEQKSLRESSGKSEELKEENAVEQHENQDSRLPEANKERVRRLPKKKIYGMMGKRADRCAGKGLPMGTKTCSPTSVSSPIAYSSSTQSMVGGMRA
eukprot:CAMPEP_0172475984 /NCGR_PEP_ID=MMETSP1065-20121228/70150_1 /TAXON_ID=265537 /ORGANISM="Amphiprora paludosa, Strain CCMP125" /LENGTH=203 /DNA_ID=CAMNT_0013234199 /DNA_START=44 /DNA_END=655 /DNA_ORIENTATION=+